MRTFFCWIIILACTATVFLSVHLGRDEQAQQSDGPALVELTSGRIAVGAHIVLRQLGVDSKQITEDAVRQLREHAHSSAEALRAAILVAEVKGTPEAWHWIFLADAAARNEGNEEILGDVQRVSAILRSASSGETRAATRRVDSVEAMREVDARDGFLRRHGWYGKLALSLGLASDHPLRREAVEPATRAFIGLYAMMLIILIALLAGLVLLIIAIVFLSTGYMRLAPRPRVENDGVLLEAFTLYVALFALSAAWDWLTLPGGTIPRLLLIGGGTIVAFFWPRIRGMPWRDVRLALGLTRVRFPDEAEMRGLANEPMRSPYAPGAQLDAPTAQMTAPPGAPPVWTQSAWPPPQPVWTQPRPIARPSFIREIFAGVIGYIALLPLAALALGATFMLNKYAGGEPASHPIVELLNRSWLTVAMVFFLAVIFAPVTEEIFFRGAFFGHTRNRMPWPIAAMIVGVIFAAVHPQGWTAIPVLGTIGFNLAAIRQWRGGLIASMTAHALNNGFVLSVALLLLR